MNYQLAKQFKDAGWKSLQEVEDYSLEYQASQIPLSELIEACGNDFKELVNTKFLTDDPHYLYSGWLGKQWIAYGGHWTNDGDTPKEAVAKLWLALNQKND